MLGFLPGFSYLGGLDERIHTPRLADREIPILVEAGDYIRFVPVSEEEYLKIKEQVENGTYECIIHTKEV